LHGAVRAGKASWTDAAEAVLIVGHLTATTVTTRPLSARVKGYDPVHVNGRTAQVERDALESHLAYAA
jgi:hypothetical protein